jgi:putative transposase
MGLPRGRYVREGEIGVYHCFTRCVRRAFLCGFDRVSGRDYSHRKSWVVDRIGDLADIFAVEVCAYAVMDTHYHAVLRTRPDIVATWSDREIGIRWLALLPHYNRKKSQVELPAEERISALVCDAERVAVLRKRLSSISWFMGQLNEFIARAANKEDGVKGRFWEARFRCVPLLDVVAIGACMVYVDLNPIRAGLAATPEESEFTSIQERVRAWHREVTTLGRISNRAEPDRDVADGIGNTMPKHATAVSPTISHSWLCPIHTNAHREGILPMTEAEYLELVDRSGRILHSGKCGAIDNDLAPILRRIGLNPDSWMDTVSRFGSKFHLAAGVLSSLRSFADQIGRRWLAGISSARVAFASSPPQSF